MKRFYLLSFAALGLFFMSNSSCKKENLDNLQSVDFNQQFELALNDSVILSKSQKELGMVLESVTDSRCPLDVQCVWAGNAGIKLTLRSVSGNAATAELCIGDCRVNTTGSDTATVSLDGKTYKILLTDVKPYPKKGVNSGEKKTAVLMVSKML